MDEKEFNQETTRIKVKQRIRAGQAIFIILVWLTIGTFAYHYLEGWSFVESLYFSTATVTTIGYGDIHPTNDASRLFTVVYALLGVGIVLFALSIVAQSVIEKTEFEQYNRLEKSIFGVRTKVFDGVRNMEDRLKERAETRKPGKKKIYN
ncbi:MAG: two pore domain potassium channel family protein [Candidatus Diapherotrites archaeon]|nr:two pore domain potassium channel family protein [Candidatus Diapherotrites archaeon]